MSHTLSLISKAAFSASCKRISGAVAVIDGMARFAIAHGASGQTTPANSLIGALRDGGLIGGATGKAALAMLGEGLKEFCVIGADASVKARKGSEWLSFEAAAAAALALKGCQERITEAAEVRAEAKAKAAAAKAASVLIKAAAPTLPPVSPLALALQGIGTAAEAEAAKMGERIGETRTTQTLAAYSVARALLAAPGLSALLAAALPMMAEAEADAKAEAEAAAKAAAEGNAKADADAKAEAEGRAKARKAVAAEAARIVAEAEAAQPDAVKAAKAAKAAALKAAREAAKAAAKARAEAMSETPALGAAFEAAHAKAEAAAALV